MKARLWRKLKIWFYGTWRSGTWAGQFGLVELGPKP